MSVSFPGLFLQVTQIMFCKCDGICLSDIGNNLTYLFWKLIVQHMLLSVAYQQTVFIQHYMLF